MRTKMLPPAGILVSLLFECAASTPLSTETSDPYSTSAPQTRTVKSLGGSFEGEITGTPAPNSKFARVRIGMVRRQVEDLIGPPNDTEGHITGKQFILFSFGDDTDRLEAYYKNEGRLTFSPRYMGGEPDVLIGIGVDPKATGERQ